MQYLSHGVSLIFILLLKIYFTQKLNFFVILALLKIIVP